MLFADHDVRDHVVCVLHSDRADAETVARNHGISKAILYNWKSKYSGMEVSQVRRLKELEEENRKLKQMHYEKRSRLKKRLPTRVKSPLVMPAERVIKLLEKVIWLRSGARVMT